MNPKLEKWEKETLVVVPKKKHPPKQREFEIEEEKEEGRQEGGEEEEEASYYLFFNFFTDFMKIWRKTETGVVLWIQKDERECDFGFGD